MTIVKPRRSLFNYKEAISEQKSVNLGTDTLPK